MGKLNVKIIVTSEQRRSNVLCTSGFVLLVQGIELSYLWSRAPISRKMDGFISQM